MGLDDDLLLLRAYEPVTRFTDGEYFFPVSVERYVRRASLWRAEPGASAVDETPPGGLTLELLAAAGGAEQGLKMSLSGIGSSPGPLGVAHIPIRERPRNLKRTSRLASVGLSARLLDAVIRFSLLFRGSVPGGSAAHSFLLQRDHLEPEKPTYYGRVLRDYPWIVCQYWFFYSFNNWRSAYGGVNEHEADWEQVTVYLDGSGVTGPDGLPPVRWVVFSAHDETGDDLRRRSDDPDLELVGGRHPVVYVGAGSHSGAYLSGDYLITVRPPKLKGLVSGLRWVAGLLAPWSAKEQSVGVPYVDYARGDGRAVGPAQPESWHPVVINDETAWVRDYRGLWGRDTRDRLGGERGPAGPRYHRDGRVRPSWGDPVGWAGLAKVAPNPAAEQALVELRIQQNDDRLAALDREIDDLRGELTVAAAGLAVSAPEVRALAGREQKLLDLRMERTRLADEQTRNATGAAGRGEHHPHAHLLHRRVPMATATGLRGRFISWWAVISTPLVLAAVAAVVSPLFVAAPLIALIGLLVLLSVEGLARGKFLAVLLRILLAAVAVALLVLLWFDGRYVVTFALVAAGLWVLVINLREFLRR
ncbi:hypothetical protein GCM10010435_49240 [Winogradskya consettensis]|uniref:Uncharacterized protein n=1 Tax=Winogradskya consettensis TaxID=113560 RepID=A0A919VNX1_9ACTN|nr:hypothetical protein [Actinoplanes consettensis]GIM73209.1 hypothetical protein Aco04nite_34170 [Actinoplanes consettensis]